MLVRVGKGAFSQIDRGPKQFVEIMFCYCLLKKLVQRHRVGDFVNVYSRQV
jgi:hypothetical protein